MPRTLQQQLSTYAQLTRHSDVPFAEVQQQSIALAKQTTQVLIAQTPLPGEPGQIYENLFSQVASLILPADHLLDIPDDLRFKAYNPIIQQANQRQQPFATECAKFLLIYQNRLNACDNTCMI